MDELCTSSGVPAPGKWTDRLVQQQLPTARLGCYTAPAVALSELGERLVVYFYPGTVWSPEDGYDSPVLDVAQHRAFALHSADFLALVVRL